MMKMVTMTTTPSKGRQKDQSNEVTGEQTSRDMRDLHRPRMSSSFTFPHVTHLLVRALIPYPWGQ